MKRILVVFVLLAGLTAVAFASFSKSNKKVQTEKKTEKKECKRKCLFFSSPNLQNDTFCRPASRFTEGIFIYILK